jgi:thiamine biosynthesis lipoprotein
MPSRSSSLRRARPLLGTLVEIGARGAPQVLQAAVDQAFAAIARVHELMSFHDPASDVSRLNREALRRPVAVDDHTVRVLEQARRIAATSDGAFDITVAGRLVQWGYLPGPLPSVAAARHGYRSIELLPHGQVRFHEPVLIDLGGIAKGYAVDAACRALESQGVTDYVVNAGGDLRVGAVPVAIEVRHPAEPAITAPLVTLVSGALATSARYFAVTDPGEGARHPIVAPATGAPARYSGSISVRASECMTADALTKVVAVLGAGAAPALERWCADAVLLSDGGDWRRLCDCSPDAASRAVPRHAVAAHG